MKLPALLLLASCGGAAAAADAVPDCEPPSFTEPDCINPGGGVTRCAMPNGSYWDQQPTGRLVHWRDNPADPIQAVTICIVEAQ